MKQTTPSMKRARFICPGRLWANRSGRLLGILSLSLVTLAASAQLITNNFTDGEGTATPDQYAGVGGNGWSAGWVTQLGTGAQVVDPHVITTAPLNGGGNYLNWGYGFNVASTMRRQFSIAGPVDPTWPYVIEFDFRTDVFTTNGVADFRAFNNKNDYVSIAQNTGTGNDVQGKATFWVKAQGAATSGAPGLAAKMWSFFDANPSTTTESAGLFVNSTNVPYATNTVYHFKISVDPSLKVYEGQVSDGVNTFNSTAATGRKLRWRNFFPSGTDFSNTTILTFVSRQNAANATNIHSLDNIAITQVSQDLWPVRIAQVLPYPAHTFYPAASNLSFTAVTFGPTNTLPASGTTLLLNGVDVSSGLSFSGTDSDTNRTITYSSLKDDIIYNGSLIVKDQAGRPTTNTFFFDTFVSNDVALIEVEHFNFDPDTVTYPPCSGLQTDTSKTDRYIQNWDYSGLSGLDPTGVTNMMTGYFARKGAYGIDYDNGTNVQTDTNFRTCMGGVSFRKQTSDDFERPFIAAMGIDEYIMEKLQTNNWFNYTHEWPNTNYIVFLRGGARFTNFIYKVDRVTSDYKLPSQTTANLGKFVVQALARRETLKYYPLVDDNGYTKLLTLNGKETLRLTVANGSNNDDSYLNYMVFQAVPTVSITITNLTKTGSDLSFTFNTIPNLSYRVQYKTALSDANWSTLPPSIVGTGDPAVVHDTTGGTGRIYRVVSP
jgi:hypothetical protein